MKNFIVLFKNIFSATKNKIDIKKYLLKGQIPWTHGYHLYKSQYIQSVLEGSGIKAFKIKSLPKRFGFRLDERVVEYPWFFSKLNHSTEIILDAGSVLNFDFILNLDILKKKKLYISTLDYEKYINSGIKPSYLFEDVRKSSFKNNFFDKICCLSTLEHIGMDNTFLYTDDKTKKENNKYSYLKAISEFYRILKKGGSLYLSFPYGKYKNHGWFQVFDEKMVNKIISCFKPSNHKIDYFKYENNQWNFSNKEDCRDGYCYDASKKLPYEKDYLAFSRCVACLELIK